MSGLGARLIELCNAPAGTEAQQFSTEFNIDGSRKTGSDYANRIRKAFKPSGSAQEIRERLCA